MCRKFIFWFSFVLVLGLIGNASAAIYDKDIGGPAIAGSALYDEPNDTWTVTASGADIWGNADQFHMVYRPMEGDGAITANLASMIMDPLHAWCKAGVMIRETTEAGSKHAALLITGVNGAQFGYRPGTNGGTSDGGTWALQTPPKELTIERVGNTFTITYWHVEIPGLFEYWQTASVDIDMKPDVVIGLAVTSHDNGVLLTALYDSVVWPADPYEKAWEMRPLDGTSGLGLQPTLTWMPGDSAAFHDVYLGTDPAALDLVEAGKIVGDESYTPPTPLETGTTYYWQIVEQPLGVASPIQSFSTYIPPAGIERCIWEGRGEGIDALVVDGEVTVGPPTWCDNVLTSLNTPADTLGLDNYLGRMQGLLWPETGGDYTFWIAGDDDVQLYLSSDESPDNLTRIAYHYGWNNSYNWYDTPEQQSAPVTLVGGQKYWIRAFWKEGGGGDHCAVAWQGPDQPDAPVQGNPGGIITSYYFPPTTLAAYNMYPEDGGTYTTHEVETLSWSLDVSTPRMGLTAQEVYLGEDGGSMALIGTPPLGQTSLTIPLLDAGKTYNLQVKTIYGSEVVEGPLVSFSVAEWVSLDIGRSNPEPPGGSTYDPVTGKYTIKAAGSWELWGQSDEFHYLYTTMEMTRDIGAIQARVLSITEPDSWRRAGVMIRENRAANARKVMAHKTGHDNTRMQYRQHPGWDTWNGPDAWGLGFPHWVRVERQFDQFSTYRSYDGVNWTYMNTVWCPMEAAKYVCIGLAVGHHPSLPDDQYTIAEIDNLSITTPDPRQSWNPSPSDGAEGISLYPTLTWGAGDNINQQMLFFSDSYEDVLYGLVEPVMLPATATEYEVGPLDLTKPYYWAVDSIVQEGHSMPVILGNIWSFRVEDSRLVEDFEAYDDPPVPLEPLPEQVVIVEGVEIPGYTIIATEPDSACLLAEYLFEGDFNDTSGNGFDGTAMGAAAIVVDADRGNVLSVNDGDYVDCGNPAALNFGTGDWTLSAWVKSSMIGTGDDNKGNIISNGRDNSGGYRYALGISEVTEGKMTLTTDDDVSKKQATSSTSVNDGVWRSIIGSREGDYIKIYINGVLEATTELPAGYDLSGTSQDNVLLGAIINNADGNPYKFLNGVMDDARIYGCAMTEGNIRWLAELGDLVVPDVCVPPIYGPLALHYEFEGDLSDSSGNNRDGTIVGDPANIGIEDDPEMGLVLSLPGGSNQYVAAPQVGISGNDPTTIACWAKADHTNIPDWTLIFGFTGTEAGGGDCGSHFNIGSIGGPQGIGAHAWCWEETILTDQEGLDWHHYAMTYDGSRIDYFADGLWKDTDPGKSNVIDLSIRGDRVHIGSRITQDSSFPGKVDDARVYNTVLTDGQILTLAEYAPTNSIYDTWTTTSGSLILDWYEQHGGVKSMETEFGDRVEARRDAPFGDWLAGDAKALVMYFKGDPCNVIDEMRLILWTDAAYRRLYYDGDMANFTSEDWSVWNIDLTEIGNEIVQKMRIDVSGIGKVNFDDLRLYPSRCVPEYGPMYDFTGDCIVDTKDLRIHAGEWLAQTQTEDWAHRAVYFDSRYPNGWADLAVAEGVRDHLVANGYTEVNAPDLKTWMDDRIADGALSVVVMAQDIAPDTVAESADPSCTLRQYLNAGGKVVQYADIPFYNQGHADGTTTNWADTGSRNILGFWCAGAGWDSWNTVSITDAGALWGLAETWPSLRPAIPTDVDTILATDDDGDASGWQKRYVPGDFYRGFVYIADFNPDPGHEALIAPALLSVAEYRGGFVTDTNGDGAVNFKDYALIVGEEWLVEQLWP